MLSKPYQFNNEDILFSTWRADFDLESETDTHQTSSQIWAQLRGLRRIFRTTQFLTEAFSTIEEVIAVDSTKSYQNKASGSKVQLPV